MGYPEGYVDALRCWSGRACAGCHERRALLGRMGGAFLHDGEDAGGGQQHPAVLLLGVQRRGHHGRPATLRADLQGEQVP